MLFVIILLNTDIEKVMSAFRTYSLTTIMAAVLIILISAIWAAVKWHFLLPTIPFSTILHASFVRYFYSLILVGQVAGDLSRIYTMRRHRQYPLSHIAASVLVDRIGGLISLLILALIGQLVTNYRLPPMLLMLMALGVLFLLFGLFILRFDSAYKTIESTLSAFKIRPNRFAIRISSHIGQFLDAIRQYSHKTGEICLNIFGNAIFQLLCIAATALLAGELNIHIPMTDWFWIFGLITMLQFLPISISGLGLREGGFIGILGLLGITGELALALSLSIFGLQIFLGLIGGIVALKGSNLHQAIQ